MDSPMGLGEKHAQQNFNERGGEFQPPWFCWGGHFFFLFSPFFSPASLWGARSSLPRPPTGQGCACTSTNCTDHPAICGVHRALVDLLWQILYSLLNNSSLH